MSKKKNSVDKDAVFGEFVKSTYIRIPTNRCS